MKQFFWGSATAAYQVEGGVLEGGRGYSVWDAYCRIPGRVREMQNADIACDSYHRFEEDIKMLQLLGVNSYRFSIAWPRILPTGRGEVNRDGLVYYNNLIDALLAAGITPFVTLYHWDLPLDLEMAHDGWLKSSIVEDFACLTYNGPRITTALCTPDIGHHTVGAHVIAAPHY